MSVSRERERALTNTVQQLAGFVRTLAERVIRSRARSRSRSRFVKTASFYTSSLLKNSVRNYQWIWVLLPTLSHTLASCHLFVELAQGVTADVPASPRILGLLRNSSRKTIRPRTPRIPFSVRGDHNSISRVQMRANTAKVLHAARGSSSGPGASARAAGGTSATRPPASSWSPGEHRSRVEPAR